MVSTRGISGRRLPAARGGRGREPGAPPDL